MKSAFVCLLIGTVGLQPLYARIERGGGGGGSNRVAVQNRSNISGQTRNTNLNQTANVNRNANINQNVNVNRNVNVDVHGGYYCGCCYHEDSNWGAFAAGAAVGGGTKAAGAA